MECKKMNYDEFRKGLSILKRDSEPRGYYIVDNSNRINIHIKAMRHFGATLHETKDELVYIFPNTKSAESFIEEYLYPLYQFFNWDKINEAIELNNNLYRLVDSQDECIVLTDSGAAIFDPYTNSNRMYEVNPLFYYGDSFIESKFVQNPNGCISELTPKVTKMVEKKLKEVDYDKLIKIVDINKKIFNLTKKEYDCTWFVHNNDRILNPLKNSYGQDVDPYEYYGMNFLTSDMAICQDMIIEYLTKRLNEIIQK